MEAESGDGGLTYRYVYGLEKVETVIYGIESGAGSVVQYAYNGGISGGPTAGGTPVVKLYSHQDRLGTADYLTDNIVGKVTSYVSYDGWGALTAKAVLKLGARELDLVNGYTGHPYDMVLGAYYAKARMYDAENRRFMAVDPVKGAVTNPQTMVQYTYCLDNPIRYIDPFGLATLNGKDIGKSLREETSGISNLFRKTIDAPNYYRLAKVIEAISGSGHMNFNSNTKQGSFDIKWTSETNREMWLTFSINSLGKSVNNGDRVSAMATFDGTAKGYMVAKCFTLIYYQDAMYIDITSIGENLLINGYFQTLVCEDEKTKAFSFENGSKITDPYLPQYLPDALYGLTEEEKLMIKTVSGEANSCSLFGQEAIAHVIMNRVKEQKDARLNRNTVTDVIKYTGFDAYTTQNNPYKAMDNYLNNRIYTDIEKERTIEMVLGVYNGVKADTTNGVVLYYSPEAQKKLHQQYPTIYKAIPNWNINLLVEVSVLGAENDDLKFYKYK